MTNLWVEHEQEVRTGSWVGIWGTSGAGALPALNARGARGHSHAVRSWLRLWIGAVRGAFSKGDSNAVYMFLILDGVYSCQAREAHSGLHFMS